MHCEGMMRGLFKHLKELKQDGDIEDTTYVMPFFYLDIDVEGFSRDFVHVKKVKSNSRGAD
jgi:hypothetical protein